MAGEQPSASAERDPAQRSFGGIVAEANPPVGEEAREGVPALEYVIHRLGEVVVARQLGALPPIQA
jgi:hypothetical protein